MTAGADLWQLVAVFAPQSLLSFGGGQSVIADIDRQVVDLHGWIDQSRFVELFAVSRAAPGPGALISTLIGWEVKGVPGAVVASLAYVLPSSLIAFVASQIWGRHSGRAWQSLLERALAPIAVGLVLAGAFTVLLSTSRTPTVWLIAATSAATFIARPKLHPIYVLIAAGLAQVAATVLL
jgi:chromate transporter